MLEQFSGSRIGVKPQQPFLEIVSLPAGDALAISAMAQSLPEISQ